ncbi:hypothetical protein AMS68_003528 [Peltaster fructicola]|uniref:Xylose isomerase-like TIM barrel domain-containing protein n=1 Tax=Peltaster fructicola TaxID=286661 RepID=A0A6H0XTL7_9PEZI|nr:hypothetical protein AMS68_003528 [Peltaster fructicola]
MPDSRFEAFLASEKSFRDESSTSSTMLDAKSLESLPLSYATCSVGYSDEHTLPRRLDAIATAGFQAIELSMPDIVSFANMHLRTDKLEGVKKIDDHDFDDLVAVSGVIKAMCDAKQLKVLMLQPFANFEGWAADSPERKDAWERAHGWRRIMEAVGTDMLQVGSSDSPEEKIGTDRSRFVKDLQELADFLAEKKFRICYENWCWSTHAKHWEDVWDICQKVDRPNFGLCLDTFQSSGSEYADPTTKSGLIEDGRSPEQLKSDWKASCEKLSNTIPASRIFLLQISDGYKPSQPIPDRIDPDQGLRPRGVWSHDFRPLPGDGYLPVADFARAVLKTGFREWFSYEVFDGGKDGKGREYDLTDYTQDARKRQKQLIEAVLAEG